MCYGIDTKLLIALHN